VSLLIAGLTHPNQNIYWISDEDNIFANYHRSQDMTFLASSFTSYYAKHPLGELGIGTTQIDEDNLRLEDLMTLPDLLAGALAEVATNIADSCNGHIPAYLALNLPAKLSSKTKRLIDWLADDGQLMKRPIIVFDLTDAGLLQVFRLNLS
jgi:arsenate reductase-like glutaredoxin family protein